MRARLLTVVILIAALSHHADAAPPDNAAGRADFVAKYRTTNGCFNGPLEVRVLSPDGSPAAGVPVSTGLMLWYSEHGTTPPPLYKKTRRTDEQGRLLKAPWFECMFPTMFYALDEQRGLAGLRICESMEDLMDPQIVRLGPARWVTGRIVSSELASYGLEPSYCTSNLYPNNPINARSLRYHSSGNRFRFLVPSGEYALSLQGEHLEWRRDVKVFVPEGTGTLDLGDIELRAKGTIRLKGRPAPRWRVDQWLDGADRSLEAFRGQHILLCFWQHGSDPDRTLRSILSLTKKHAGDKLAVVVIHPPTDGGFDKVREILRMRQADQKDKKLELDVDRWPFVFGLDQPARMRCEGQTCNRYGGDVFSRFLIDPKGTVVLGARAGDMSKLHAALHTVTGK